MISRRSFIQYASAALAASAAGLQPSLWASSRRPAGISSVRPFRVAISADTLAGANLNDARAAYKVWGEQISRKLDMSNTELHPEIFIPSAQMIQMIRAGDVDCFALTAWEFAKVSELLDPNYMMVEDYAVNGVDYLLLVHATSQYRRLEDLRGAKMTLHHHRDTLLVEEWIACQLATAKLPLPERFFEAVDKRDNLNQVLLPLFFRRIPAAAMTRRVYDTAVELNPQLAKDLRIIAVSPKVVGDGFFFRLGCDPEGKRQFQDALVRFKSLPAGQQCLALYQASGFSQRPCSIMSGSLELIRQYERLLKGSKRANG